MEGFPSVSFCSFLKGFLPSPPPRFYSLPRFLAFLLLFFLLFSLLRASLAYLSRLFCLSLLVWLLQRGNFPSPIAKDTAQLKNSRLSRIRGDFPCGREECRGACVALCRSLVSRLDAAKQWQCKQRVNRARVLMKARWRYLCLPGFTGFHIGAAGKSVDIGAPFLCSGRCVCGAGAGVGVGVQVAGSGNSYLLFKLFIAYHSPRSPSS